ncbi:flavin-containing monooxygenase [Sinosporangium siamense]|uniref:Monooxygenase n=1 Tax=Sinosporangium siamense TaxID=1367973 RepID=A0A919RQI9_9ACTN|nr:NAD(P)/FAD-dependent oxidoreductase [Sinosporangium siamense]GII96839.1 monooxygenase [Sinosporangium siamense]
MERSSLVDALTVANLPTVLMVLHHLTGDDKWLREPYRPRRSPGMDDLDSGGFSEEVQQQIRSAAADIISRWDAGAPIAVASPDLEHLHRMTEACMGEPVPMEFAEMIGEQSGLGERAEDDPRAPHRDSASPIRVGIVGAGVSGMLMARQLRDRGIECVVFERNPDVGGSWLDNRYPGCGVDTPSYLYSFSFYRRDWSTYFGKRDEVLDYLQDFATDLDIRHLIRFGHEVHRFEWSEERGTWTVSYRTSQGAGSEEFGFVVSAVGQLNVPSVPDFPGVDGFSGQVFHSARWPGGVDLTGKRVAVVGSGASAMQIVPAIVDDVDTLTIFQRSKQWVAPNADYFRAMDARVQWLMRDVPFYHQWYRARLAWIHNDRVHESLQIDPMWDGLGLSINSTNDGHRRYFTDYLLRELDGRPDLVEKALPDYPPFGKRMLLDNGWFKAIRRPNVELVTSGVDRFTRSGVVGQDGDERAVDVVILATGFQARNFLVEIDVEGPAGSLREAWGQEDARAYLGMTVPGFPNLFITYGPNSNLGHGGSYITIAECQAHYLGQLIGLSAELGLRRVEVRSDVYEAYNAEVDAAHAKMIWNVDGLNSWYRNSKGRVVTNSPWRVMDYWKLTRSVDLEDYRIDQAATTRAGTG